MDTPSELPDGRDEETPREEAPSSSQTQTNVGSKMDPNRSIKSSEYQMVDMDAIDIMDPQWSSENQMVDMDANQEVGRASVKRDKTGAAAADLFQPREGRDLIWKDLSVTLWATTAKKIKNGGDAAATANDVDKKILDSAWGEVPAKHVTAIMGPSGSGKTTVLNVLAGRIQTGGRLTVQSDVRLNNIAVDPTDLSVRQKIAFVAQDDSLQVTATPREAIFFSAKLRLPASTSHADLTTLTERMLDELGLQECADTFVGGALVKGISGGERKRTSVGVELVTRPAMIFLDEPTSGLDSFNALKLCKVLAEVANAGSSVLLTIHQPSSEIFSSLDRLILLHKGRVMFQGPVPMITDYFEDRGYPCPSHYNPADHVMNVAQEHKMDDLEKAGFFPKDERKLGEALKSESGKNALGITEKSAGTAVDPPPGFQVQTRMLFKRELLNLKRDLHSLRTRTIMTMAISLILGCLFFQIADDDFNEADFIVIQSTFGALLMSLLANVFATALPSLLALPAERPVFLREYQTNHYSVVAYFSSRLTMEMLITGVQVTVSSLITYFMCGFTLRYGLFWSALYIMALASTALGVFVGCSVEDPSTAIEFLPAVFMPQILFSGFFVPPHLMPDWLAWIQYICPLTYGVWIVVAGEFGGDRCGSGQDTPCYRILDNTGANPGDTWWYYLVLIGLFVVIRLAALRNLRRKASKFY